MVCLSVHSHDLNLLLEPPESESLFLTSLSFPVKTSRHPICWSFLFQTQLSLPLSSFWVGFGCSVVLWCSFYSFPSRLLYFLTSYFAGRSSLVLSPTKSRRLRLITCRDNSGTWVCFLCAVDSRSFQEWFLGILELLNDAWVDFFHLTRVVSF